MPYVDVVVNAVDVADIVVVVVVVVVDAVVVVKCFCFFARPNRAVY